MPPKKSKDLLCSRFFVPARIKPTLWRKNPQYTFCCVRFAVSRWCELLINTISIHEQPSGALLQTFAFAPFSIYCRGQKGSFEIPLPPLSGTGKSYEVCIFRNPAAKDEDLTLEWTTTQEPEPSFCRQYHSLQVTLDELKTHNVRYSQPPFSMLTDLIDPTYITSLSADVFSFPEHELNRHAENRLLWLHALFIQQRLQDVSVCLEKK